MGGSGSGDDKCSGKMKWKPLGWWAGDHSKAYSWEDAGGPQSEDLREVATQGVPERVQDEERNLRDGGANSRASPAGVKTCLLLLWCKGKN